MTNCLTVDALVSVGAAVEWDTEALLDHLTTCEDCRSQLRDLARAHDALRADVAVRPGFTDAVLRGLPDPAPARDWWVEWATPVLAGGAAFFAIALAASQAPMSVGAPSLVASALVAAGVAWWERRDLRSETAA